MIIYTEKLKSNRFFFQNYQFLKFLKYWEVTLTVQLQTKHYKHLSENNFFFFTELVPNQNTLVFQQPYNKYLHQEPFICQKKINGFGFFGFSRTKYQLHLRMVVH